MALRALVCTDGSEPSRLTARAAARLARPLKLRVTLAYALNLGKLEYKMIPDFQVEMIREGAKRAAEELLKREADFLRAQGAEVAPRLLVGDAGTAICELAAKEKMDLVILGRRGQGDLQDILFGSVSNHVVHHSPVPVLVVKREGPVPEVGGDTGAVRVLVGVDGSRAGERCLDFLATLAEAALGLEVTLISVVNPDRPGLEHLPAQDRYDALQTMHEEAATLLRGAEGRLRNLGLRVSSRAEEGSAGRTLCRVYQEDGFDIMVLGRRGTGELADVLFGSVCHYVLHHCPGHALVVP
jgi:nucleotide-binding universal stress UspA family protein